MVYIAIYKCRYLFAFFYMYKLKFGNNNYRYANSRYLRLVTDIISCIFVYINCNAKSVKEILGQSKILVVYFSILKIIMQKQQL